MHANQRAALAHGILFAALAMLPGCAPNAGNTGNGSRSSKSYYDEKVLDCNTRWITDLYYDYDKGTRYDVSENRDEICQYELNESGYIAIDAVTVQGSGASYVTDILCYNPDWYVPMAADMVGESQYSCTDANNNVYYGCQEFTNIGVGIRGDWKYGLDTLSYMDLACNLLGFHQYVGFAADSSLGTGDVVDTASVQSLYAGDVELTVYEASAIRTPVASLICADPMPDSERSQYVCE